MFKKMLIAYMVTWIVELVLLAVLAWFIQANWDTLLVGLRQVADALR